MRRTVGVVLIALAVPSLSSAHVTITPPFVNDGTETQISFATPNERAPHATIKVETTAPPGIEVVSASAPPGWLATINGQAVSWTQGRLTGTSTATFPLRVVAKVRAGTVAFTSAQTYDDGATVRWTSDLAVLPATGPAAPKQHPWGALIAASVGAIVIVLSLVVVRALRRRSLQLR